MSATETPVQLCSAGHPWTPENTMLRPSGGRRCRQCASERNARWRAENRTPPERPKIDGAPWVSGDGCTDLIAAIVRQALHDYRVGWHCQRHPEAAVFLRQIGILRDDGTIDTHGHKMPAVRMSRTPAAHDAARRAGKKQP